MNKNRYPLSYNQLALWRVYQLAPKSTAYNVYSSVKISSHVDIKVWTKVWSHIVQKHGIIRTTYTMDQGEPLQIVHPTQQFEPEIVSATSYSKYQLDNIIIKSVERPFNLETGPVFRVSLFHQSDKSYIQLLTIHEIAGEMRSLNILTREFKQLYSHFLRSVSSEKNRVPALIQVSN